MAWCMFYMIEYPEIQLKVQEELDKITGGQRLPQLDDRQKTPYTEAVIHECQRMANVVALFFHASSPSGGSLGDGKFVIPPNTTVACNFGAVLMDPEHFTNPEKFKPERYLDSKGQFQQHPKVVSFGIGKRRCIGKHVR